MAVTTPLMRAVSPPVQPRSLDTLVEHISPEEEINIRLLDDFYKSCTRTAQTHLASVNAVPPNAFESTILTLPLKLIKKILRSLLTSPRPLILRRDAIPISQKHRTYVEPSVLQVCKAFHNIGVPILYGENTLTTSSPATSYDFDEHLASLPGSKRQMITSVKLEIDWADQLWAKFPLVATALEELRSLRKLEIIIIEDEKMVDEGQTPSIGEDVNLEILITYGQPSSGKVETARQQPATTSRADRRMKREGPGADAMLKIEMKTLKDLVSGIKGLKDVRLKGFRDEVFAWCLEEHARIGNH